jgi:serine/threonine protein kinase
MEMWSLNREQFDDIAEKDTDLLRFLTEIIANRFDSKRSMADRAIGKYVATDIIGRGGFSIVYKGMHTGLNLPVAIKMMRHDLATDPDFINSFRNEAKMIASLNHDNIIRVYDIEERFRTVFVIMELADGESLQNLLNRIKLAPIPLAVDIIIQVCSGLQYAHQHGIVHRDVKPGNILLLPGDRVKILDFGIACTTGTRDANMAGTIAYMSPEQIQGDPLDPRADIYALGVSAYEMVTGEMPFPEDDFWNLEEMHLTQEIPDPAELRPDIPHKLRRFIVKACRRNPAERYADIGAAINDLNELAGELGVAQKYPMPAKQKMTSVILIYKDEHQVNLNRLMEAFSSKAKEFGIEIKAVDYPEI